MCVFEKDADTRLAGRTSEKETDTIPAQGLEPWTTSFRYAKPENAIGSANSPLRSDLFFRTRYSSGNLIY